MAKGKMKKSKKTVKKLVKRSKVSRSRLVKKTKKPAKKTIKKSTNKRYMRDAETPVKTRAKPPQSKEFMERLPLTEGTKNIVRAGLEGGKNWLRDAGTVTSFASNYMIKQGQDAWEYAKVHREESKARGQATNALAKLTDHQDPKAISQLVNFALDNGYEIKTSREGKAIKLELTGVPANKVLDAQQALDGFSMNIWEYHRGNLLLTYTTNAQVKAQNTADQLAKVEENSKEQLRRDIATQAEAARIQESRAITIILQPTQQGLAAQTAAGISEQDATRLSERYQVIQDTLSRQGIDAQNIRADQTNRAADLLQTIPEPGYAKRVREAKGDVHIRL